MSHGMIPHIWLVGPGGWLCVAGQHAWGQGDPYGPCVTALPYAVDAIVEAEAAHGIDIRTVAGQVGIVL